MRNEGYICHACGRGVCCCLTIEDAYGNLGRIGTHELVRIRVCGKHEKCGYRVTEDNRATIETNLRISPPSLATLGITAEELGDSVKNLQWQPRLGVGFQQLPRMKNLKIPWEKFFIMITVIQYQSMPKVQCSRTRGNRLRLFMQAVVHPWDAKMKEMFRGARHLL